MENHRGEIAIILAGYTKPLLAMIETNPGLKSRMAHKLTFADYDADELGQIFTGMLGAQYQLALGAPEALMVAAKSMLDEHDEHFGNGRDMRTLFEQSVMRQADRLAEQDLDQLDEDVLRMICAADIVHEGAMKSKNRLGFAA